MASRAAWAGFLGAAMLAGALSGCGDGDGDDVHSTHVQAEAAKDPAANATAPAPAKATDAAEMERRAQAMAAHRTTLSAQEDALSTAPAPYEGDSTAATSLPPQTDDAPPAQPNTTAPRG